MFELSEVQNISLVFDCIKLYRMIKSTQFFYTNSPNKKKYTKENWFVLLSRERMQFIISMIQSCKEETNFAFCLQKYYKKYIRVVFAKNMKNIKDKVQFHPQRPNRSKSRTRFSPYQAHHSNDKQTAMARQNREKLALKEPIIKIKELMGGNTHTTKLSLNTEKPYYEPNLMSATNFSNCNFHSPFQTIQSTHLTDLAAKIDQQSEAIEQYFTQLNQKLKLPKIEPYQQKNEKQAWKQKQTQNMILEQLKQLKLISSENVHLREIILRYERESQFYRKQLQTWQHQSTALLQKISTLQNKIKLMESEKQQQKKTHKMFSNQIDSKSSIKVSKEYMKVSNESATKDDEKFMQTEKEFKNQIVLIESLNKEIQNLKLQNQMLTQEVKLLNYSLNERDRQIDKLKRRKSSLADPIERSSPKKSSICQQINFVDKPPNELQPKKVQSVQEIEIDRQVIENLDMNSRIRQGKKTKSFVIEPTELTQSLSLKPRRSQMHYSAQRRCSIDSKMLSQNILKILSIRQTPTLKQSSTSESKHKVNHQKLNAEIDKRKLTFAKSILRIKPKTSVVQDQSGKRQRKEFIHFNAQKKADLQIVRKTIGARWRVLRFSFADIQLQLLERKNTKINQKEMVEYLQFYPFFLNVELIEEVVRYILRNDFKQEEESEVWPSVEIDVFCNCLREFIPEMTPIEQDVEMVILEKIRKVVLSKSISLLQQLRFQQIEDGIISESQMRTVLQQFKFSQPEIQLIIGQCCLISLDIEHLNYEKYFSFFNPNLQSQN